MQIVRRGYDAVGRRDIPAILALLDSAIEYRMPMDPLRRHPAFCGHDGVRAFYEVVFGAFEEYRPEVVAIHDLGRGVVVATGRLILRRAGGDSRAVRFSHFWEVRDGRVARVALHDAENPLALVDSGERRAGRAVAA